MLVLSRRIGEQIVVPGCDLTITVVKVKGHRVRLGLSAPEDVLIQRAEIARLDIPGAATGVSDHTRAASEVTYHPR
jgi:carbon storage regulator